MISGLAFGSAGEYLPPHGISPTPPPPVRHLPALTPLRPAIPLMFFYCLSPLEDVLRTVMIVCNLFHDQVYFDALSVATQIIARHMPTGTVYSRTTHTRACRRL